MASGSVPPMAGSGFQTFNIFLFAPVMDGSLDTKCPRLFDPIFPVVQEPLGLHCERLE